MANDFTTLVATNGWGIWRSSDGGETFHRPKGLTSVDFVARRFGVDPHDPQHVLMAAALHPEPYSPQVGTVFGLHESRDGGASWTPVKAFPRAECWTISFDPDEPGRYFVGTRPAALYRTDDDGASFTRLPFDVSATCPGIGLTRVTSLTIHPQDPKRIISTVEIGGVHRSLDGGDHWEQVMTDISVPLPEGSLFGEDGRTDCHFSRLSVGDPDVVLVSTPDAVYQSEDFGDSWERLPATRVFPSQYHREMAVKLDDPNVIFIGIGDDTAGTEGALLRSQDRGRTWEVMLAEECNSPVWCFGQFPGEPETIVTCTLLGFLFVSRDAGKTWTKTHRQFSEVRGICCLPAA